MRKVVAQLDYNVSVNCPYCGKNQELTTGGNDDEGCISRPLFNNQWCEVNAYCVCNDCDKEFIVSEIEY